jgi:mycothiol synthase
MVRSNLEGLPRLETPEGYEIRTYREGDEVHWANIINASFGGERTAEHTRREIVNREVFDPEGLFFATYQGIPVGTACAWKKSPDEKEVGYVHMVGVDAKHTGRRLGKLVSLCVLVYFRERGFKCVMLDTDDFRLPAVKTYLNLSFLPVYVDVDQPERWRRVFENLGLPPTPDRSGEIRAALSDRMWALVSR